MTMANNKVVIIGAGSVGATYAYALLISGQAREIVLVDMDRERAIGEVMDLQHGIAFTRPVDLKVGDYRDCEDADLVVVTAGAKQRPGETRLDLAQRNAGIIRQIVREIMARPFGGILLIVSNPVDVLTQVAWQVSGLPRARVLGSGTVLDSARLRSLISAHCHADPRNVHVVIIGEHGDSEVAAWSAATIGGVPILEYCAQCRTCPAQGDYAQLLDEVKRAAYEIISRKGATFYAIGLALVQITEAILRDEHRILPVSSVIEEFHGLKDVALSLPALVGSAGVERVLDLRLAPEEMEALRASAGVIKSSLQSLNLKD
jgi:L-lactate dehydrogenase